MSAEIIDVRCLPYMPLQIERLRKSKAWLRCKRRPELAFYLMNLWNGGGKRGIYTHCVNTNRQGEHPTEKPLALMMEIVGDFTRPGETICDPFMGSGTTGVACAKMGRSFIGIEQNERWFDLSCERIRKAYAQPDMFVERPTPAKQLSMLGGIK
ncbi:DNA methyltransferase [Roseixanthobacter pseudopolyaromaticivorans]|uniref:DNA methyltransferase n=1 Tax=Xanthobacteraceae TaxID=335928 RepID=UPI00372C684A